MYRLVNVLGCCAIADADDVTKPAAESDRQSHGVAGIFSNPDAQPGLDADAIT